MGRARGLRKRSVRVIDWFILGTLNHLNIIIKLLELLPQILI